MPFVRSTTRFFPVRSITTPSTSGKCRRSFQLSPSMSVLTVGRLEIFAVDVLGSENHGSLDIDQVGVDVQRVRRFQHRTDQGTSAAASLPILAAVAGSMSSVWLSLSS